MENQPLNETERAVKLRLERILNSQMSWPAIERALTRLSAQYPNVRVTLDALYLDEAGGAA